ncbi:hypothetical protein [Amycolatopsis keratiniphila]|uniref:hypothetical protein n=1 Tax=Amycolatopsis keratiniphila TaxID=129921 RepID=UPI001E558532|nr:hypothetical protein [Amycolatopsis keratiniphila]
MTEEPSEVDSDRRFRLETLCDVVQAELAAAGLPVAPGRLSTGAVVSVDLPDLRGVLIDWREHAILLDAGQEAWADDPHREGEECAAFSQLMSAIGEAMAEAIRKILTAAGLEVSGTDNDYAPHELLVTRRVAPSVWSVRRDAQFTRRHDSMRAAWSARNAAECPNPDCETHHSRHQRDLSS